MYSNQLESRSGMVKKHLDRARADRSQGMRLWGDTHVFIHDHIIYSNKGRERKINLFLRFNSV